MEKDNPIRQKSYAFAKRIVNLYKHLYNVKNEHVLSKQILRSGTSIGANITEANFAISKKEFTAKMYISYKECAETIYWLELLCDCNYITKKEFDSIYVDCLEIQKMLAAITKTAKK